MSRRKRQHRSKAAPGPAAPNAPAAPPERLRPWLLGVACTLLVARPLYPSESPGDTGDGLPVVMLWIALAVVWMLGVIGRPRFAVRFGWLDVAVLALVAWHTLAAVVGAWRGSPRPAVNMLWEWVGLGLLFFLARQFIAGQREARAVAAVMLGLAVALSGHGLYQYVYELPRTRAAYWADPDQALRDAGQWFEPGSPGRAAFEKRLESVEPLATFALTNSLAGFLTPWLVVAGGIALGGVRLSPRPLGEGTTQPTSPLPLGEGSGVRAGRRGGVPHPSPLPEGEGTAGRVWIGLICAGAIIAFCLVLTKSRSAYAAVLAGAAALGAWSIRPMLRRRDVRAWRKPLVVLAALLGLIAVLIGAAAALGGLDVQVVTETSKSLGYRMEYWRATGRMIAECPLFGCGPGNFHHAYTQYKLPEASEEIADPHNFLLEIWATAGTPAAAAMLAVIGLFVMMVLRGGAGRGTVPFSLRENRDSPLRENRDSPQTDQPFYPLAGGVFGFFLAAFVGGLSAAPPGMIPLVLGLPLAAGTVALLYPWIVRGSLPPIVPALGAAALLVNLLAAGGIGFAGVAGSLWLTAAIAANAIRQDDARVLPWSAGAGGLVAAMALFLACHQSAFSPVLRCKAALRRAHYEPLRAEAVLRQAAEDDPLASEPAELLASLAFQQWAEAPSPDDPALERLRQYTRIGLEKAPNSAAAWFAAGVRMLAVGNRFLEGFEAGAGKDYLAQALAAYDEARRALQEAVRLYPNSPIYRARLAEAFFTLHYAPGFEREAREALRLDEITPHADKKLPDELRNWLVRRVSGP